MSARFGIDEVAKPCVVECRLTAPTPSQFFALRSGTETSLLFENCIMMLSYSMIKTANKDNGADNKDVPTFRRESGFDAVADPKGALLIQCL